MKVSIVYDNLAQNYFAKDKIFAKCMRYSDLNQNIGNTDYAVIVWAYKSQSFSFFDQTGVYLKYE